MLARAVFRQLRAPAERSLPSTTLRAGASTQWSRAFAKDHQSRPPQKRSVDYSKPLEASPASGRKEPQPSSVPGGRVPGGFARRPEDASIRAGTTPNASSKPDVEASSTPIDDAQPEIADTQNTTSSASEAENAEASNKPLPDLRYGIPSTLEFEMNEKASKDSTANAARLNLTEDPEQPTSGGGGGGGSRGRGELPPSAYMTSGEKRRLMVANYAYLGFAVSCLIGAMYLGRDWGTEEEERRHAEDAPSGFSPGLWWARVRARMGDQLNYYSDPAFPKLLPDPDPMFERPYTLVISLEDMLLHSEWSRDHGWRMAKRPGVDYFLRYLSQYYELVIFTSVPWAIADPVIRKFDPYHIVTWPLFREATVYQNGEYIKDLSYLNRDLSKVIMMDTVESHAKKQPENAIILPKWKGDSQDVDLVSYIPFLEYLHTMATPDVRLALKSFEGKHIPTEFARREAIARKRFEEQMAVERKKTTRSGLKALGAALGLKPQPAMEGEQSITDALAAGKMLQDQARERGLRNYQMLEKEIRENGEKWLKEEAAHEERAKEEGMKAMKSSITGVFGVPGSSSTT